MDLEVEEEELQVLEYARLHGLCKDYTTEQLHIGVTHVPSSNDIDHGFRDPLESSITQTVTELTRERLTLNKDAALLLQDVHSLQQAPAEDIITEDRRRYILGLKQELPILRTDNELDLLNFGSTALPHFKDLRIPSEIIHEENDEGFGWPSKYLAYASQCNERVNGEKIAVSKEALVYLQEAIRDTYTTEDSEHIKAESLQYKPNTLLEPLTPPLLPLSPPLSPYIPSSPGNRLPLPSESSDSLITESKALERQIMAADSLERRASDDSEPMLLDIVHPQQFSPLFENQSLPTWKRRGDDLKVEGPLTPPIFSTSPMKKFKSVSFANDLHEYFQNVPREDDDRDNCDEEHVDSDQFYRDIEPLARQANMKIDNERLSEADTTARVDVPHVDFSLPVAPWNEYSQRKGGKHRHRDTELSVQMNFLLRIKRKDLKAASSWHGLTALERELRWGVFTTKMTTLSLDEQLHGDTELSKILSEDTTSAIATSSSQVWKKEGLRILEEEEDNEDLELADNDEQKSMDALIRKRKFEMEEAAAAAHEKRMVSQHNPMGGVQPSREAPESHNLRQGYSAQPLSKYCSEIFGRPGQSLQAPSSCYEMPQPQSESRNELMFGGFSTTSALHRFMETRGKSVKPASTEPREDPPSISPSNPVAPTLLNRSKESLPDASPMVDQYEVTQLQAEDSTAREAQASLPYLPKLPKNLKPCSFIVSLALLQQRALLKQIEQLYPEAEIIYRDYNLRHSAAKEADVIISPSSGLIFTTLQQVKQKALPGQPDRSLVKEVMATLQSRYERLVVMVSEGLSHEMEQLGSSRPDDPRNKEVLSQLEDFAAQLESEVLVKYVQGGQHALAHSTVLEMVNYGLPHGSPDIGDIKPLAVETSWEVFLRRAGLNPFAAQVIVASLKQPFAVHIPAYSSLSNCSDPLLSVSVSGLPAFIVMSADERVKYFQAIMGGSRILRRLSSVLDQEWISAAHGFRM
ncbi:hypothetical protein BKA66DRAFT_592319 [Pyrenochaeta sp. MPI-SDFR-AT-0127]|nr:hypothetical protein BKA66DRAFT_592319 [Pyrenochaeta sp. MPI-SDFR-AT-0127]